jgi:hypothetical protein
MEGHRVTPPLPEGVYESLRTTRLDTALDGLVDLTPRFAPVEAADEPHVLARHVAAAVERALAGEPDSARRLVIVNELLGRVEALEEHVAERSEQLVGLSRETAPGVHQLVRPITPLSSAALLTNAHGEPSLSAELRAELGSADHVDLLCAFVRWHGVRVLEEQLDLLHSRGIPFRVITTTYVGATELKRPGFSGGWVLPRFDLLGLVGERSGSLRTRSA